MCKISLCPSGRIKGVMTTEEFCDYIGNNVMKLYPDTCDEPGKCVLLKMDSGPGRDILELIAKLRMRGFYLCPIFPNATHVMQEMDVWLGKLKTVFNRDSRPVIEVYVTNGKAMPNSEDTMGLLFFLGCIFDDDQDPKNVCENALQISTSKEKIIAVFSKIGTVPITRECINDKHVRHDICVVDGETVDALDPMTLYYIGLEAENHYDVTLLIYLGYKGDLLKAELPRKYVADCYNDDRVDDHIIVPLYEQTILALMCAKTIGDSSNALTDRNAGHLTSADRIIYLERIVIGKDIRDMEDDKKL
jgi:hypothetical protein